MILVALAVLCWGPAATSTLCDAAKNGDKDALRALLQKEAERQRSRGGWHDRPALGELPGRS